MNKYLQVFKISFAQEFAYRANFIMWRVRNVLQIFLVFFLWDTVFSDQNNIIFGYDRAKILTYVFAILVVKSLVLSARAVDVAGDIYRGDIMNHLLKPISYFKYWFTRDLSSKGLNLIFAATEFLILFIILRPPFFLQTQPLNLFVFLISLILAMFIFFNLLFITSSVPFWAPELGWGSHFLVTVIIIEFLSGSLFPIDILPETIQNVLLLLPFPYLIFFPIQVYLGKVTGGSLIGGIAVALFWAITLWLIMNFVWKRGLKAYQAHGR